MQDQRGQELVVNMFQIQHSVSEQTQYQNDPHIYNNYQEYILSLVGLTVGFGSFWRFPYLIFKNGGGVFLIPYVVSMLVVGIPLLYLETAIGQMHRSSLPFVLKRIHPALKMLGVTFLLSSLHMASVYNLLLTYSYRFVFSAFNPNLPFAQEEITENTYFHNQILKESSSINQFGSINPVLFLLYVASLLICHYIIKNGVKESGKIIFFTALSPFIFFIVLLLRGLFLKGAFEGLSYLFEPKWHRLLTSQVWIDALVQVFYQLSIAVGSLVSLSSMKPRRQDFLKGVYIVPVSIIICGMLSALNIFVYLGHFCSQVGIKIDDPGLHLSGLELSYNVFPKALSLLPFPNLWVFIFFIAMVLLGIDSQFGLIEGIYCYLKDEFKNGPLQIFGIDLSFQKSKYVLLGLIMIGCPSLTSSAGIYYLQFYDQFVTNVPFTLGAIVEVYIFVHLFKFEQLQTQIVKYTKTPTPYFIRYFLQSNFLIILLLCNFAFATYNQLLTLKKYDLDFYLLGWTISLYPYFLAYYYFRCHWTQKSDLKLTMNHLEKRESYL